MDSSYLEMCITESMRLYAPVPVILSRESVVDDQIADLHHLMWDWHGKFIPIEEALAHRAGTAENTAAGWEALSASPEMAAYRASMAEGKQACADFQAELDATVERGVFADTPWIPSELKEVVDIVLGCDGFPEHPEDVYRYPPPTSSP